MKKVMFAAILTLLAAFTLACGDDGHANLRVMHASPGTANIDAFVGSSKIVDNLAYGAASNYIQIGAGTREISVTATGSSDKLVDITSSFAKNTDYTVLALDTTTSITALQLQDDNSAPTSGNIKLRIVHASPSANAVDVYITAPGADLSTATPTLSNVAFKSASDYQSLAAGDYEVRITPAGTKTVVIDSGTLSLASGQIRTVVALDAPAGGLPLSEVVISDAN